MSDKSLKRLEVKYIRDKAKSLYPSKVGESCEVCSSNSNLQFHHYKGVTNLWNAFKRKHKINITTVEDIEIYRDRFISVHASELFEEGTFLCKSCHDRLHSIYGKSPSIGTSSKQRRWVGIQREKAYGFNS